MNNQSKSYFLKPVVTALSLGLLLTLSACSGSNPTEETATEAEPVVEEQVAAVEVEEEVIAPADKVDMSTATSIDNVEATEIASAEPELLAADAGAKLYEAQCKVCHENGLLNAPKYGDSAAWSVALAKDKETLYMHSAQGFNKMPAQAINGVTEAQVKAAVDYMLAAVS
ncbi:cytochrome c5 family protein [uncultured Psychrobacter sp.]|uniref:c-type cytochrome n=1 Tax=uncultured Psychrobacter sp. TaxID=259303 RepID=UPI0034590ABF